MINNFNLDFEELEVMDEMLSDFVRGVCDGFMVVGGIIGVGCLILT